MLALARLGALRRAGPHAARLDHQGLLDTLHSGDPHALAKGAYFGPYPLRALVPFACGFALLALVGARLLRNRPDTPAASPAHPAGEAARSALPA